MSRIANQPVVIPSGVEVKIDGQNVRAKGSKGEMVLALHPTVNVVQEDASLKVQADDKSAIAMAGTMRSLLSNIVVQEDAELKVQANGKSAIAMAGTMRSLLNNIVVGVSQGFEKKLELVGVGYRAQTKGKSLNLSLGFSHPVDYPVPEGITIETPSQTEIVVKGSDKQRVGQVAAEIRAYRPPEPYKGKGVKYADERIVRKEAKKK